MRALSLSAILTLFWLGCLAAALPSAPVAAQGSPQDGPITIDATLVTVPVIVSDRNGRFISGLKQSDFTLYDERAPQPVAFFSTAETPLNVAVLIDTSRSAQPILDDIKRAATQFLRELRPQDRATVIAFDNDVRVLSPLVSDRTQLERAVAAAQIGNRFGTLLNDAVILVTQKMFRGLDGRKAIILLTDGQDYGSVVSAGDLLETVVESETLIYPILYQFDFDGLFGGRLRERLANRRGNLEARRKRAEATMAALADVTAGRLFAGESSDIKKAFRAIADELRNQYQLGFYPDESVTPGGAPRALKVAVSRPDVVVRARRSYRPLK
jgi:VWFA-related protein